MQWMIPHPGASAAVPWRRHSFGFAALVASAIFAWVTGSAATAAGQSAISGAPELSGSTGSAGFCARFRDADASQLPQAVFVPPLVELAPYSIQNPGQLSQQHDAAIRDVVERAVCAAQARKVPFSALRLTVYPRTDDRGARAYILDALRQLVPQPQLDRAGRAIVDVVAAWHRARVLVDALREAVGRQLRDNSSLGGGDPAGMVQPTDLTTDEPRLWGAPYGSPDGSRPRSFVVVISLRESSAASSVVVPCPSPGSLTAAPPTLPPPIQVVCPGTGVGAGMGVLSGDANRHAEPPVTSDESLIGRPELDVLLGAVMPVESYTRSKLFKDAGLLGLGIRLPIHRIELGVRLSFLVGKHSILYTDTQSDQLLLGAGAGLQVGFLLVKHRSARWALGAEVGWTYLRREITQSAYASMGQVASDHLHLLSGGGWTRLSLPLPRHNHIALTIEAAVGAVPFQSETEAPANVTVRALGGVTYGLK